MSFSTLIDILKEGGLYEGYHHDPKNELLCNHDFKDPNVEGLHWRIYTEIRIYSSRFIKAVPSHEDGECAIRTIKTIKTLTKRLGYTS